MTVYLDSNVFIYAVTEEDETEDARKALERVEEGEENGVTSVLTVDEVVWIVQNQVDRETAIETGRNLIGMPHLDVLDCSTTTSRNALHLMEDTELDPRDALHAATALDHGVYTVVSSDDDLEEIDDLERKPIAEFADHS